MLKALLAHPLTRGLDIDDPQTTHLRQQIIQEKYFLRKIYEEWYQSIAASLPSGYGAVLELGSGAGFYERICPPPNHVRAFPLSRCPSRIKWA